MNQKLALSCLVLAVMTAPVVGFASDYTDADRANPKAFVKDSAITVKVKAKLASEHMASLAKIKVDTDANGVVWLNGSVSSQEDLDKAVSIVKNTEGVVDVHNELTVKIPE